MGGERRGGEVGEIKDVAGEEEVGEGEMMDEVRGVFQCFERRRRENRKRVGYLSEWFTIFICVSLFYCKIFD